MEEEKIETTQEQTQVNNQSKKFDFKNFDFKNFDFKKYLPYALIALAAIVVLIILVSVLGGGPKKAVKQYISGMNNRKAKTIIKIVDPIGTKAWGYQFDEDDFDEDDYEEFLEGYKEHEKEFDEEEYKDEMDDMIDEMDDMFEEIRDDYKSYKIKAEDFKKVEKLGKDLYAVDVKISVKAKPDDKDDDEIDRAGIETFVVYKNKIISGMGF